MNETLLALVMAAIAQVESSNNHRAIAFHDGGSPSYGAYQIKLQTARQMGFQGYASDLWLNREVNYEYARKYLLFQYERYGKSLDCAIVAYNAGSIRSRKTPGNSEGGFCQVKDSRYLSKVKKHLGRGF